MAKIRNRSTGSNTFRFIATPPLHMLVLYIFIIIILYYIINNYIIDKI